VVSKLLRRTLFDNRTGVIAAACCDGSAVERLSEFSRIGEKLAASAASKLFRRTLFGSCAGRAGPNLAASPLATLSRLLS